MWILHPPKRSMLPRRIFWVLAATHFTPGKTAAAHELGDKEGCQLWIATRTGKSTASGPGHDALSSATGIIYLIKQLLCFSQWGKDDAIWSLWQAPIGESWHRLLWVWSQARPSLSENDTLGTSLNLDRDGTLNNGTLSSHESRTSHYELGLSKSEVNGKYLSNASH